MNINRSVLPEAGKEIVFNLPEIEYLQLDNKLQVLFVENNKLPVIQLSLLSNAGSSLDPIRKKGLSNLLSAMLDEGAGKYNALQLADEFEFIGSILNLHSEPDGFFVSTLSLSENLDRTLELFSMLLTQPHLAQSDFQREKNKTLIRILQSKDDPGYLASINFEKIIFGEENPYGLTDIGTPASVEKIEVDDLKIFYDTLITPSNSTMVVVGNIKSSELREKLNSTLFDWKDYQPPFFEYSEPDKTLTTIYLINKDDAAQSEIRIGHIVNKRNMQEYFPNLLMNNILGGQFSSRINLNLREDKGYTYGAHSAFQYYKHSGYFYVSAAVNSENTADSITEILNEINGIKSEITDKELRFAKSSLIKKFPSMFETCGQIARNLSGKLIHNLPDDYFNTYISNVKNTGMDQVHAAAQNLLPEKLIILVVGDKNIIKPQLEKLSFAKIIEIDDDGNRLV